jgi:hypothetical protein
MKKNKRVIKRPFIVLAAAIILFPLSAGSTIQGDINDNDRIDLSEAIYALRVAADLEDDPTHQGDINYDNVTDLFEVIYALQVSVGLHPQAFLTVVSAGDRIWMARNLGASRVAETFDDPDAYGDLYQWGRLADGHEDRTSSTTSIKSSTDVPVDDSFILVDNDDQSFDWRDPQNDNMWQGVSGINNPCPIGFRLPTALEFDNERISWDSTPAGPFESPLALVMAGSRSFSDALISGQGSFSFYWSSTALANGSSSSLFFFSTGSVDNAVVINTARANGYSVRCIKEE